MPSVGVMTEKFVSAADLMGRVLGAPDAPYVVIPHPISSASAEELSSIAQRAADDIAARLSGRG